MLKTNNKSGIRSNYQIGFDRFCQHSRFLRGSPPAVISIVRNMVGKLSNLDDGFVELLEINNGSIMAFKDPKYHSSGRKETGCFGLLTAPDKQTCVKLVECAMESLVGMGIQKIRGPVNMPRFLFGYGIQASGFSLSPVAGVSWDPPCYAEWFSTMVHEGMLHEATRYISYTGSLEKSEGALKNTTKRERLRVFYPDFNNPGSLPVQIASLLNAEMYKRPDGFYMDAKDVLSYAELFKLVVGGERLLAFLMDGDTLAGGVIMQPDWFQVLAGSRPTRFVQDTIVTASAYQGKGYGAQYFELCADVMRYFKPEYFEY
nr:hypothetical protein [Candidatus Sigynarchaeota archaeon]